jgi:hypothetical protein
MLPPMGGLGSGMFFAAAVLTNAILYGLVASYIWKRFKPAAKKSI